MRVALAAAVAGRRHLHEPGVQPVLQVAAQDAVLDEHGAAGRRALVVHVERAAPVRDRAVVHHGHQLGGHLLAEAAREGRHALAVEVALEAVADRLVEQDARPAGAEHDGHGAGRRLDGSQLQDRLARSLAAKRRPALLLEEEVEGHAAAAAPGADLALAVVLGDHGDVEPGERPHVADRPARGRGEQHHDFFAGQAGDHLLDARIGGPRGRIDTAQQVELALERGHDRWLDQRVEIVRPPATGHGERARGPGAIRDGARLSGGLLEVAERDLVGVGVAGPRVGLGPDAGPLADVA